MKVLHLISSGGMYGAESVILNLCSAFNAIPGQQSALGVFRNTGQPNTALYDVARRRGIESHLIACEGQFDRKVPASIRSLTRQIAADVVHAHGYKADVYTYLALRSSALPFVATCHNWLDENLTVRLYGAADRWTLRHFTRIAAVSEPVRRRLLDAGVAADKVVLIKNGIDMEPYSATRPSPLPDAPLVIGTVARLSPEKGVDIFIRAAALVLQQIPTARFTVAGDGPDRETLQALISELQVTGRVTLLGRQEDMPAFYRTLDLFVLSSRTEGLPMALLEAMASGLPVVATRVGQVASVVQDNRTGRIVAPEDSSALSAAILDLLRSSGRSEMGSLARDSVQQEFSAARMAAEYLKLYQVAARQSSTLATDGARRS